MADDIKWLFGALVAVVAAVGGFIARDRALVNQIRDGDDNSRKVAKEGADALHERVNKVRDEFVRRDDLDGHIKRFERSVSEMRGEMRHGHTETNKRLDTVMETLSKLQKSNYR